MWGRCPAVGAVAVEIEPARETPKPMPDHDSYQSPLVARNASRTMIELFGPRQRILIWRRLWLALAESQKKAGLKISDRQLRQLRTTLDRIDFKRAARHEKKTRHDVMAHLLAWGDLAPEARGILHLGATSAYIVDNADLMIMRDAMRLIADWLANVVDHLARFAKTHRALPTLGFTHYQPAQTTTVGKRAAMWCWDFVRDLEEIEHRIDDLRFRGVKGKVVLVGRSTRRSCSEGSSSPRLRSRASFVCLGFPYVFLAVFASV